MQSQITENRLHQAEFVRNVFAVNPEFGVTAESMLVPSYWAHVGHKLKAWDKIEARAEDGSFYAEFLVIDSARTWARVKLLTKIELEKVEHGETEIKTEHGTYAVKWAGPHAKYRVLRGKDVMRDGFASQKLAQNWLDEHLKTVL